MKSVLAGLYKPAVTALNKPSKNSVISVTWTLWRTKAETGTARADAPLTRQLWVQVKNPSRGGIRLVDEQLSWHWYDGATWGTSCIDLQLEHSVPRPLEAPLTWSLPPWASPWEYEKTEKDMSTEKGVASTSLTQLCLYGLIRSTNRATCLLHNPEARESLTDMNPLTFLSFGFYTKYTETERLGWKNRSMSEFWVIR